MADFLAGIPFQEATALPEEQEAIAAAFPA
jgi:hypothetical protein